jgi:DNA invertase Pin-like site-specific DNA recombinase
VRVSTETQDEGFGLDVQILAIEATIAELGLAPLVSGAVYADEGISGKEGLDGRAGLAAALDYLDANPGSTLVIPRLDRLARDLMVQEQVLADIWRTGATVVPCSAAERVYCQPDNPDDPARTLIRQVLGAVAAYERTMIRLRMTRGRRRLLEQQGWAGGPVPYGWTDPAEVDTLATVNAMRHHRYTWQEIAGQLNQSGRMKRNGQFWTASELQRVHRRWLARRPDPTPTLELT